MAARNASPTAQLLRSSRLFSLPRPLPEPVQEGQLAPFQAGSSTLPYPVRQAITRPNALRKKEEWGLKRSLPSKAAGKAWKPTINIIEQDGHEEITEYKSATDHTRTLQKWQEMAIPMRQMKSRERTMSGQLRTAQDSPQSAFNRASDITDRKEYERRVQMENEGKPDGDWQTKLWKYNEIPVSDMTDGDFELFLQRRVGQHHSSDRFKEWLRQRMIDDAMILKRDEHLRSSGGKSAFNEFAVRKKVLATIDVEARLKQLRGLRLDKDSTLNKYMEEYLQLPPQRERVSALFGGRKGNRGTDVHLPLTTHPSAGLSYMSSKTYLDNHPVSGPRAEHKPVLARTLSVAGKYVLGVGGVTIQPKFENSGPTELDVVTPGGAKRWITPEFAAVDDKGRIQLVTNTASAPSTETAQSDVNIRTRAFWETRYRAYKADWDAIVPGAQKTQNSKVGLVGNGAMVKHDHWRSFWDPEIRLQRELDKEAPVVEPRQLH